MGFADYKRDIEPSIKGTPELGWALASRVHGKGYATEAARASILWVFENLEVESIVHCIDPENTASRAVAERLGASIEGQAELFGHAVDLWVTARELWHRNA